jgi:osmotically-inducible protein OsmY
MSLYSSAANDAHLIQNVRSALGRNTLFKESGINVSSCGSVVTLHGIVRREADSRCIEHLVRRVPGVQGVENRLRVRAGMVRF